MKSKCLEFGVGVTPREVSELRAQAPDLAAPVALASLAPLPPAAAATEAETPETPELAQRGDAE